MREKSNQYVISIMSRDRVGIIFEVSSAIRDMGGNIADVRQSVLCGYFTMILLAEFPPGVTQRDLERKFSEVDSRSETAIDAVIKPASAEALNPQAAYPETCYVLTATGSDRIGFVATVSSFCVRHNLNILDLSTTVSDGEYVMILVIDVTGCASLKEVRSDLQQFASQTGLKLVLQHYDIFRAVNEINLPRLRI